jgi:hypothetical protein
MWAACGRSPAFYFQAASVEWNNRVAMEISRTCVDDPLAGTHMSMTKEREQDRLFQRRGGWDFLVRYRHPIHETRSRARGATCGWTAMKSRKNPRRRFLPTFLA